MRKLLISTVLVLLAIFVSLLVVQHYKNYQNKKSHEAAITAQKKADEIAAIRNEASININAYKIQVDRLSAECEKGKKAYDILTAVQKAKVAAPVCQP
jgi:hypothetical protein